tara:strand:- start:456 stop:923 length:468 start_codon:yes stop_codon:yes gene_type:complete
MFTILKNVKYLLFFLLFISINVEANQREKLALHGGYTFETNLEQKATAVYLSFFNNSDKEIEIESFSTDVANSVEMHDIKITDDVVKMFKVEDLQIKSKSELFLQPGGRHLMLFGLKKKLNDKESFVLKVHLKNKIVLETNILVLDKKLKANFLN